MGNFIIHRLGTLFADTPQKTKRTFGLRVSCVHRIFGVCFNGLLLSVNPLNEPPIPLTIDTLYVSDMSLSLPRSAPMFAGTTVLDNSVHR